MYSRRTILLRVFSLLNPALTSSVPCMGFFFLRACFVMFRLAYRHQHENRWRLLCRSGEVGTQHPAPHDPKHVVGSLNYCSQNGGNLYRAPYYNGNPNIGPRIIGNLDQYPRNTLGVVVFLHTTVMQGFNINSMKQPKMNSARQLLPALLPLL